MRRKNKLYKKCKSIDVRPGLTCEVGVYMAENSNVFDFIDEGIPAILVEPDPRSLENINRVFAGKPVSVYPFAMYDHNGTLELVQRQASTFAKELPGSPALVNDTYRLQESDVFSVECRLFSNIDPGNIDLISIDIEGSDWYVIKHMLSRPKVISIETHGKVYTNPFLGQIQQWTRSNGYVKWYKTGSDTVYCKEEVHKPTGLEKFQMSMLNIFISFRKFKLWFKRGFKAPQR